MIDVYRKNALSAMVVMKASSCHVHPTPAPARTDHGDDAESRAGLWQGPSCVAAAGGRPSVHPCSGGRDREAECVERRAAGGDRWGTIDLVRADRRRARRHLETLD